MPNTKARREWRKKYYSSPYQKSRTNDKILALVKRFGPISAIEIAKILGLTPHTVSPKLIYLSDKGKLSRLKKEVWPRRAQYVYEFRKQS